MDRKIKTYRSEAINVTYDVKRCIHAKKCVQGLPTVFDVEKRPWIQPDQAAADAVAEMVMRCPTGALHFERLDGGSAEPIPTENQINVRPNGPLFVRGNIKMMDSEGTLLLEETRVALCRCGGSSDKPFCDGAHRENGFADDGTLGEEQLQADSAEGELVITVQQDGPYQIEGTVILSSADGSQQQTGHHAELCRCGASGNKPFCDWTHVSIGFEAN